MSFRKSVKAGDIAENFVNELFTKAGFTTSFNKSNLIGYDLSVCMNGREFTVEVKFDIMEAKTGNLAIEYYNTRLCKPSGIMATKSNIWIVVLKDKPLKAYATPTAILKEHCSIVKPTRQISNGGDDNAALWLYPSNEILPAIFHRIDELTPTQLSAKLEDFL